MEIKVSDPNKSSIGRGGGRGILVVMSWILVNLGQILACSILPAEFGPGRHFPQLSRLSLKFSVVLQEIRPNRVGGTGLALR